VTGPPPQGKSSRVGSTLAVLVACTAVVVALTGHVLALVLGIISVLFVASGVLASKPSYLAAGTLLLVAGSALAFLAGSGTLASLAGLGLAFVVWDCGEYAIGLGEQVGRAGITARQELRYAGASLAVATVGVGIGWGVLTMAPADVPVVATVLLAVGSVLSFVSLWS